MSKFLELLEELDHGRVVAQLDEHVERVVDGVQTHGKKGEIKITLKFDKEGDRCVVSQSTDVKVPTEPLHPTAFFFDNITSATPSLTRDDPRQLQLKSLDKPKVKEVSRGE